MKIGVEKGLGEIKEHLKAQGFDVSDMENDENFDAVVFLNTKISDLPVPQNNGAFSLSGNSGTLLVCAKGLTGAQISAILRQKRYNNIF